MKTETKEKVLSLGKDILLTIGILGFVTVGAIAGNAVQLLKYTPLGDRKRKIKNYELNRSVKRLLDRGFLQKKLRKNIEHLELTDKGQKLILKYELESLAKVKPPKWDKKYRVVIFDISENRRGIRDRLRVTIRGFGFIQLQQSVWIYPYPCQDIIELLKKYLEIQGEVIYMTVDSIEDDEWLKENFGLK